MRRTVTLAALVLAGESIYTLPYYVRRDFGKVLADVMQLTQTELGLLQSMFGVLALVCYAPGGWLADRRSPRGLLTFSLASTALGGLVMMSRPGFLGLLLLYAFWGITSILTFWAALLKATRAWGSMNAQGRAFGWLEGGRGLIGASLAWGAVAVFSSAASTTTGLQAVIGFYSVTALITSVLVWWAVPAGMPLPSRQPPDPPSSTAFRISTLAWHALIIFCAYGAYWGTFDLSTYAIDAYAYSASQGAFLSASVVWSRLPAAVLAGVLADRIGASRTVSAAFTILIVVFATLTVPVSHGSWRLWLPALCMGVGTFALRGTYFALLHEGRIPTARTGLAAGLVSMIAFTPDILIPPALGWLLDHHPEDGAGHRLYFAVLGGLCLLGVVAAIGFRRSVSAVVGRG